MPTPAPLAISDSVRFTTILKSSFGGPAQPQQLIIGTDAEYQALFGGHPPAGVPVNFAKETVLMVGMGTQNTSGFSTEIVSIIRQVGGFNANSITVGYSETHPSGPTLQVITQPWHVVKCETLIGNISFVKH